MWLLSEGGPKYIMAGARGTWHIDQNVNYTVSMDGFSAQTDRKGSLLDGDTQTVTYNFIDTLDPYTSILYTDTVHVYLGKVDWKTKSTGFTTLDNDAAEATAEGSCGFTVSINGTKVDITKVDVRSVMDSLHGIIGIDIETNAGALEPDDVVTVSYNPDAIHVLKDIYGTTLPAFTNIGAMN
jgi:hypothetical protein